MNARLPPVYALPHNDPDHHDVFAPGARLKEVTGMPTTSRYINTETIRRMSRDELEDELSVLGIAIDERDVESDDDVEDDRLRDALMTALSEQGDPGDCRGDYLYDQQKDDDLRGDR